jgi:hypothetical protein
MNLRPKSSVFGLVGEWIILGSSWLFLSPVLLHMFHMDTLPNGANLASNQWCSSHRTRRFQASKKASCKPHLTFPATWAQTDLETWWASLWHYVSVMQAPHDFYSCGPHDKLELELELLPPTSRMSPAIAWNADERILWEGTNRGETNKQREEEEEDLASAYSFWGWIFAVESSRSWS